MNRSHRNRWFSIAGLAAFVLLFTGREALADEVYFVGSSTDAALFLYPATITSAPPGYKRAWELMVARTALFETAHLIKGYKEYDCAEGRSRTLRIIGYDRAENVVSTDNETGPWRYVAPGTLQAKLFDHVCQGRAINPGDLYQLSMAQMAEAAFQSWAKTQ